jgi:hypothetical protein
MYPRLLVLIALIGAMLAIPDRAIPADFGHWPYERLFKESDVVLIGTYEETKDADEIYNVPDSDIKVRIVKSKLKSDQVLKGEFKGDSIEFRHWAPLRGHSVDGAPSPLRLAERKVYTQNDKHIDVTLQYLVFLRRTKDGQYEPVSGIIGAVFAIKELHRPAG